MRYAFIMRGIPGSGKSTVAHMIADSFKNNGDRASVHSTDDLCMVDGEYHFDPELAGARHAQNLENFKDSLERGIPCVIVDNTNVSQEQYTPYWKAAKDAGYRPIFVELPHPPPLVAANRNAHGVPIEVINKMILCWEPSQHTATVDRVLEAEIIVHRIRKNLTKISLVCLGTGAVLGAAATLLSQWLTS
jgi:predicted kinase